MSCESEAAAVTQASIAVNDTAANCLNVCASSGFNSPECQSCQAELNERRAELQRAQMALQECLANNPPASRLLELEGHVTFLLVVERGSGYGGGSSNWIDADVIFKLDSRPDKSFGFQLRDDPFQPVRRGMLALLRDAMINGLKVITDYIELTCPQSEQLRPQGRLDEAPGTQLRQLGRGTHKRFPMTLTKLPERVANAPSKAARRRVRSRAGTASRIGEKRNSWRSTACDTEQ